jgi:hypothetical protein
LREEIVPHAHKFALAHCSERLHLWEVFWSPLHV